MPRTPRRTARRLVTLALAVGALLTTGLTPAVAANGSGPTAVVSMGDSYISGEAGRWQGNSLTTSGSRNGTDRAWTGSAYDPSRVYGTTAADGCHRSDSAEVRSAGAIASALVNLACSGATTRNVFRASQGGVAYKGEAPQADRLAAVAASHDVGTIVLSIGGNDLGFADLDSDWARDTLVPQVSNRLKGVAASKGVQFMDLRDMLQGREVCAKTSKLVSATVPASATTSEWARWIDPDETQGPIQENVHPNHYGQWALGRCLALIHARPIGNFSCRNTPGAGASGMYLTAVS